jgi:hypothetical protein
MTQRKIITVAAAVFISFCLVIGTAQAGEFTKIDAGPDQTASFPGLVQLVATVTDVNAPYLSIGWSKVSGPGNVEFSDKHSAITTATFTESGEYELMLGGFDGGVYYDNVIVKVEL